ncbi:ABC transporter permease [Fictibacillus sp. Mic-4]|uniref:ABC transporter permease n=1 Tax=Fictibacillus TaxID=1329200 RepID=UPI0003FCDCA4|nr:ABC transporter permease [Fictibacillus gelatini]
MKLLKILGLYDLMKYKALVYFLVHREVKVRYKNSVLGFFWTLIEPLGYMIVYSIVFKKILNVSRGLDHYELFLLSGLIPWMFFSRSITRGIRSIRSNAKLIKKIYFPRHIFPLVIVLSEFVSFIPAFVLVILYGIILGVPFDWLHVLILPVVMILYIVIAYGFALILSILNVYFRDIELMSTILLRAGQYLVPIIYPISRFMKNPDLAHYLPYYLINPLAVIINSFHTVFAIYKSEAISYWYYLYVFIFAVVLLFVGMAIFRKLDRKVGEVV